MSVRKSDRRWRFLWLGITLSVAGVGVAASIARCLGPRGAGATGVERADFPRALEAALDTLGSPTVVGKEAAMELLREASASAPSDLADALLARSDRGSAYWSTLRAYAMDWDRRLCLTLRARVPIAASVTADMLALVDALCSQGRSVDLEVGEILRLAEGSSSTGNGDPLVLALVDLGESARSELLDYLSECGRGRSRGMGPAVAGFALGRIMRPEDHERVGRAVVAGCYDAALAWWPKAPAEAAQYLAACIARGDLDPSVIQSARSLGTNETLAEAYRKYLSGMKERHSPQDTLHAIEGLVEAGVGASDLPLLSQFTPDDFGDDFAYRIEAARLRLGDAGAAVNLVRRLPALGVGHRRRGLASLGDALGTLIPDDVWPHDAFGQQLLDRVDLERLRVWVEANHQKWKYDSSSGQYR